MSFVIPATSHYVCNAVYSILDQRESSHKFEIVIVLNNCSRNILSILNKKFTTQIKKNVIRILFLRKATIGSARNFGIKNAIGKYIIHTDSDCYLHPDYIKIFFQQVQKRPLTIARGDVSFIGKNSFLNKASCELKNLVYKKREKVCYTPNLITDTNIHKKMNLWFDTSFLYGEDTGFSLRIAQMKIIPSQIPALSMIHYDYDQGFYILKKYFLYGIARVYRFQKWKSKNSKIYFYYHLFNEIPNINKIYPGRLRLGIVFLYLIRNLGILYGLLTI